TIPREVTNDNRHIIINTAGKTDIHIIGSSAWRKTVDPATGEDVFTEVELDNDGKLQPIDIGKTDTVNGIELDGPVVEVWVKLGLVGGDEHQHASQPGGNASQLGAAARNGGNVNTLSDQSQQLLGNTPVLPTPSAASHAAQAASHANQANDAGLHHHAQTVTL